MVDRVKELIKQGLGVLDALDLAAKETGSTVSALRSAYYPDDGPRVRNHSNRLLTKRQEEVLLHLAVSFSVVNKGWNKRIFRAVMHDVFG